MQAALTGLGRSGRSSLFAALGGTASAAGGRGGHVPVAAVKVPDPRLDWLREQYHPKKFTPASIEFLDMPGLRFDDALHADENARITARLRQTDCLVAVLRGFEAAELPAYRGAVDPVRDGRELRTEFALSDLAMIEGRLEKLTKAVSKGGSKTLEQDKREQALLLRCKEGLERNLALSQVLRNPEEARMVKSFAFLTQKPIVWVVNVAESALPEPTPPAELAAAGGPVFVLCAKVEKDLAELEEADRAVFAAELGIKESAKGRLIRGCYQAMGLISFLTCGPDEVRAWTLPQGATAVEAAAAIHTDLAESFIKAETVAFADLQAAGSMKAARAAGKVRQEGKGYVVADGDVIEIKAGKAK